MKMLLAFAALILLCVGGMWLIFRVLIDDVTNRERVSDLEDAFKTLNTYFDGKEKNKDRLENSDSYYLMEEVGRFYMLFVYDPVHTVSFSSYDSRSGGSSTGVPWYQDPLRVYNGFRTLEKGDEPKILSEENEYKVYESREKNGSATYVDLHGKLNNGFIVLIRESFKEVESSNRAISDWLLLIGLIILLVGIIFASLFSQRVTKPIQQMSQLAERMASMDFEARCEVSSRDEIGVLSDSLNRLSEKLQETVGELKNANSELQSDLEHRTQVDEMRSDFIANVSHELKTPIALIQGYAEGLAENINDDAESRAFYCSVIADEAGKMNRMVQKLMALNQLEFGGNQVEYARFDIVGLVTGVLNSTEVLRNQKGITLHYHETEPVFVWADEYMIEEVVTNYISNAMNHAAKSKEIAVSLEKTDATVRVSVYNTGELIPEEDMEKIWIKFFKVDKARSREYGGSGIGLAIVKAIMDLHHRRYGAINHENGVEFWFELELSDELSPEERESLNSETAPDSAVVVKE